MVAEGLIKWDDSMSVGDASLDQDHKVLIGLLNDYVQATDDAEGLFVTDVIFGALADYIDYHFAREEDLMAAAGYPHLAEHKAVHRAMTAEFVELRDRQLLSGSNQMEGAIKDFLKRWLTDHILKTDMAYKTALAKVKAKAEA